jgi:hypothetical protein
MKSLFFVQENSSPQGTRRLKKIFSVGFVFSVVKSLVVEFIESFGLSEIGE